MAVRPRLRSISEFESCSSEELEREREQKTDRIVALYLALEVSMQEVFGPGWEWPGPEDCGKFLPQPTTPQAKACCRLFQQIVVLERELKEIEQEIQTADPEVPEVSVRKTSACCTIS